MASGVNSCALLMGLAAFADWTISSSTMTRRIRWFGGLGILALFFSVVSPDDDAFQQELIRSTPASARVSSHTKIVQRGLLAASVNAFSAGDPIRFSITGRAVVMGQPHDHLTHFQVPISIHSPPVTS